MWLAALWMTALSVTDVRHRRLPNVLTVPGAVAVLWWAAWHGHGGRALAGAAALFALYLLIHLVRPADLGAGDVKLAFGLGALTGAFGIDIWTLAALAAPLFTAVWALTLLASGRSHPVPHGLSMCAASAAAVALASV